MPDLLFEIFSEEIPVRMQAGAAGDMLQSLKAKLGEADLTYESAESFYGPRRLTFSVTGLPRRQEDRCEERKGPKEGSPEQAMQGFLRRAGLKNLDQAELRDTPRGKVWFAVTQIDGRETAAVLPDLLLDVIQGYTWPKSQRWGYTTFRWVRPLHRILAVFDGKVLAGGLDLGGGETLAFSNECEGHRFLSSATFQVRSLTELEAQLKERCVTLRAEDRKATILAQLQAACTREGLKLIEDPSLLNEVAGLTEWPTAVMGRFAEAYLAVPEECLILSMKEQQKYFAARQSDGKLANVFFTISNGVANSDHTVIRAGNERVLNARLADARFFWEQDLARPLEDYLPKLADIVFHAKLGSIADRVVRMKYLAEYLAGELGADAAKARRAAQLMKADLVSTMVCAFPKLQGIMGCAYAKAAGEPEAVAEAIASHYQPAGPDDDCPCDLISVIAALVDKIDTLVGFWLINQKPTGSKDPYALRRAALGVLKLVDNLADHHEKYLDLKMVFWISAWSYGSKISLSRKVVFQAVTGLIVFFLQRLSTEAKSNAQRGDIFVALAEPIRQQLARDEKRGSLEAQGGVGFDPTVLKRNAYQMECFLKTEAGLRVQDAYTRAKYFAREAAPLLSKDQSLELGKKLGLESDSSFSFWQYIDQNKDRAQKGKWSADLEKMVPAAGQIQQYIAEHQILGRGQETKVIVSNLSAFVEAVNQIADLSKLED